VFVTVSICLSALCVVTSILVYRINVVSTPPLRPWLRRLAFHYAASLLCVRLSRRTAVKSSRSSASVAPEDAASSSGRSSASSTSDSGSRPEDRRASGATDCRAAAAAAAAACRRKARLDSGGEAETERGRADEPDVRESLPLLADTQMSNAARHRSEVVVCVKNVLAELRKVGMEVVVVSSKTSLCSASCVNCQHDTAHVSYAAERRAAAPLLLLLLGARRPPLSIDISCSHGA